VASIDSFVPAYSIDFGTCQVAAELPIDSEEADQEKNNAKKADNSPPKSILYVFGCGYESMHVAVPVI
jgi:hypothetical protein